MEIVEEARKNYSLFLEKMADKESYLHIKSITNFMNSLDDFYSMQRKERAATILNSYFLYVKDKSMISRKESKYLFYEFILPLGNIYKESLGFSFLYQPSSIVIYFAPIILIAIYLKINILIILVIFLIGLYIFLKLKKRMKSKKVFGFNW